MGNARRRLEEQRARRSRVMTVVIVFLVLAGAVIAYVLLDPLGADPSPVTGDGDFEGGAFALIYADFDDVQDLHRLDLDTKQDTVVTELPKSGNTIASPSSSWLAIQVVERDDGQAEPGQYLFDAEADATFPLGIFLKPEFSPDGRRVAGLRPVDETRCGEARCFGDKVVVVVDLENPESESELSEPGRFTLRAWAGEHLLVSNDAAKGLAVLQSISPDGEVSDLPFPPGDLWGASPDGRYVIESGDGGTRFHDFSGGRVGDEAGDIGIPQGSVLGIGEWSHDSSRVAAFAVGDDGTLELVTFGPTDPEPRTLTDGGESSTGDVLWSPDNDALAFTRFNGTELEAVYCVVDEPDSCEILFSWTRGISLLRLE